MNIPKGNDIPHNNSIEVPADILELLAETKRGALENLDAINEAEKEPLNKEEQLARAIIEIREAMKTPEFGERISKLMANRKEESERFERLLYSGRGMHEPFNFRGYE